MIPNDGQSRRSRLHVVSKIPSGAKSDLPPVLLVHGAWHGSWCWEGNFLDYFAECGFPTYALDLRGHGKSPAVKGMRWNRIADYVDDVLDVIDGFEQAPFVIGHSMGGFTAQHLLKRTTHLSGVGLLATVPSYGVYQATAKLAFQRPLDFAKANLTWSLEPLIRDANAAKHMFLDADASDDQVKDFAPKLIDEAYLGFLDMLFLDLPTVEPNAVPMLVVGGGRDTLFSPQSQRVTATRYGCECKIVTDAPHNLMLSKHWREAADYFVSWMRTASSQNR